MKCGTKTVILAGLKATAEVVADDVHMSQHGVGVHNTEFMERGHNSGLSTL